MLSNIQKPKQKGFTIIEVLIVLAIAGLIMLVVFLAVPALQRNSRNTQRKSDISRYLGGVQEFMNNNNGAVPTTAANVTTINGLVSMSLLTAPTAAPSTGAQTNSLTSADTFVLVTGATCDTTTIGNTVAGSSRQIALMYAVEGGGGAIVKQCINS